MDHILEFFQRHFYFQVLDEWGVPILLSIFVLLFTAETTFRLRKLKASRWKRIKRNLGVAVTAAAAVRLALIPVLVYLAKWAEGKEVGLLNWTDLPVWIDYFLAFVLLDYGNYVWHLLNHRSLFLWRFHHVHHIDLDLDVTTALRFHFGEILLSVFFRGLIIIIVGPPYLLVLFYELVYEAANLFHHSNWKIPYKIEKALSLAIVTPRMHGIHHSIVKKETDSNYSVIFNVWDRLHNSLRLNIPQHLINIGVPSYRDPEEQNVKKLLMLPLRRPRPWQLPNGEVPDRKNGDNKKEMEP